MYLLQFLSLMDHVLPSCHSILEEVVASGFGANCNNLECMYFEQFRQGEKPTWKWFIIRQGVEKYKPKLSVCINETRQKCI